MKRIVAIVGMPGSGKSEASEFFHEKGMSVLRFGSIVEEGIKEEGIERSAETEKYFREKIRKELGMAAVAIKMLPKIQEALEHTSTAIILDGLYSWEEYLYLQEHVENLFLLCLYARPSIRYERLAKRAVRSFTPEEAHKRDRDELSALNKGGPIAIADYLIKNETTKEDFRKNLEQFLDFIQHDTN